MWRPRDGVGWRHTHQDRGREGGREGAGRGEGRGKGPSLPHMTLASHTNFLVSRVPIRTTLALSHTRACRNVPVHPGRLLGQPRGRERAEEEGNRRGKRRNDGKGEARGGEGRSTMLGRGWRRGRGRGHRLSPQVRPNSKSFSIGTPFNFLLSIPEQRATPCMNRGMMGDRAGGGV